MSFNMCFHPQSNVYNVIKGLTASVFIEQNADLCQSASSWPHGQCREWPGHPPWGREGCWEIGPTEPGSWRARSDE